jgi:hypothetical protein
MGVRLHGTNEAHVELTVSPELYASLHNGDITESLPSILAAIVSAAMGATHRNVAAVEVVLSA